jgi:uncharacterized phage protein (TIGR02218 family)
MHYFYLKISRQEKNIVAIIKYDQAIIVDNIVYQPDKTMQFSQIENNLDLIEIPFNITLSCTSYSNIKLRHGDFVTLGLIDPINKKKITIKTGYISEISYTNHLIYLTIKGFFEKLNINLGLQYSTTCNNQFGDKICNISLEKYTIRNIPILSVIDNILTLDKNLWQSKIVHFDQEFLKKSICNGYIINNHKEKIAQIYNYDDNKLSVVFDRFDIRLDDNDILDLVLGCDKDFTTCNKFFTNKNRFLGQPLIENIS